MHDISLYVLMRVLTILLKVFFLISVVRIQTEHPLQSCEVTNESLKRCQNKKKENERLLGDAVCDNVGINKATVEMFYYDCRRTRQA